MILTGLIGRNIGASRSPWMHEQEARAQGLSLTYTLFDFAELGRNEADLESQLDEVEALGYAGVNVTYPYKQSVIAHLDELSSGAQRVGAVNTVKFEAHLRVGYNTDVTGFAESLRAGLPRANLAQVLQMGAGGAGAATAQALLDLGTGILRICDQDPARAEALVRKLQASFNVTRARAVAAAMPSLLEVDGVVNATPMGMASHPDAPFDVSQLSPRQWVADIVYFPLETQLLRAARIRGCQTLDGSGMAVNQAAAAFEIFTGREANRPRMHRSFMEYANHSARSEVGV